MKFVNERNFIFYLNKINLLSKSDYNIILFLITYMLI